MGGDRSLNHSTAIDRTRSRRKSSLCRSRGVSAKLTGLENAEETYKLDWCIVVRNTLRRAESLHAYGGDLPISKGAIPPTFDSTPSIDGRRTQQSHSPPDMRDQPMESLRIVLRCKSGQVDRFVNPVGPLRSGNPLLFRVGHISKPRVAD